MKALKILFGIAAIALLVSCSKDDDSSSDTPETPKKRVVRVEMEDFETDEYGHQDFHQSSYELLYDADNRFAGFVAESDEGSYSAKFEYTNGKITRITSGKITGITSPKPEEYVGNVSIAYSGNSRTVVVANSSYGNGTWLEILDANGYPISKKSEKKGDETTKYEWSNGNLMKLTYCEDYGGSHYESYTIYEYSNEANPLAYLELDALSWSSFYWPCFASPSKNLMKSYYLENIHKEKRVADLTYERDSEGYITKMVLNGKDFDEEGVEREVDLTTIKYYYE